MYKKLYITLRVLVALTLSAAVFFSAEDTFAAPAKPGKIKVKQADGTELTIRLYGDEFFNYRSTLDGYPVVERDGFYYYASYESPSNIQVSPVRVNATRTAEEKQILSTLKKPDLSAFRNSSPMLAQRSNVMQKGTSLSDFPNEGVVKSVIILAEFKDVRFTIANPRQAFENQLNQEGYNVSGATGSAKDYYKASSQGKFIGDFDVYGPYTLPEKLAYYGGNDAYGNDKNPQQMIEGAVTLADNDGVDFTQYDVDGDGIIDNVFVYFAGYCEAQGGSSNTIWSHKWEVYSGATFDGKVLRGYACTSELRGNYGTTIAGIGTFCHEFSHVFGLYDHYDTTGSNEGYSYGTGSYDIMYSGNYNNDGNTPPMFNAFEKQLIGWLEPTEFKGNTMDVRLEPLQNGVAYTVPTEEEGEYFLIEVRSKDFVWDSFIPAEGLIITHVDRSYDVMSYWNKNAPNGNASHECFKFVVAGNKRTITTDTDYDIVPYPSNPAGWNKYNNTEWSNTSAPKAMSWDGEFLPFSIHSIARTTDGSDAITFTAQNNNEELTAIELDTDKSFKPIVGVRYKIKATITPEDFETEGVKWSSSNEDVMTINKYGEYIFHSSKSATIKASLIDLEDISTSVQLTPTVEEGVTGRITSSDGNGVADADVKFYAIKESSMSVQGMQKTLYTRASGSAKFSAETDENGDYLILDIPEGMYEIEASVDGLITSNQTVNITEGMDLIDITLDSYIENNSDYFTWADKQWDASIGYKGYAFTAYSKWTAGDLADFNGKEITKLRALIFGNATVRFVVKDSENGKAVYTSEEQVIRGDKTMATVELSTDEFITIESGKDYYIGCEVSDYAENEAPMGLSTVDAKDGKGDCVEMDGSMSSLSETSGESMGNWVISFYLQGEAELSAVELAIGQRDASLCWQPQGFEEFLIEWIDSKGEKSKDDSDEPKFTIEDLTPSSEYEVTVSGVDKDNKATVLFSKSFETLAERTAIPMILLGDYEQTIGEVINLRALNTSSKDVVEWYYNGVSLPTGTLRVEAGEKTVICIVKRGSEEYTIRRVICGVE